MLEMMPGSVLDKTNNLNMLGCVPTSVAHNSEAYKEYFNSSSINSQESKDSQQEIVNSAELYVKSEGKNDVQNKKINNISLSNSNKINKFNSYKEKKLLTFLKKFNVTQKELIDKIKNIKRRTKDKIKLDQVISVKLKRYYLKKIKRIKHFILQQVLFKNNSKRIKTKTKMHNKNEPKYMSNTDLKSENDENEKSTKQEESYEKESSKNILSPLSVLSDLKADDDIRSKIKQQLALLRKNKKVSNKEYEKSEFKTEPSTSSQMNNNKNFSPVTKPIPANLSDVLISNESELSIVSVVGGYVSDDDFNSKPSLDSTQETELTDYDNVIKTPNSLAKGTSITDILLQREFNSDDANLNERNISPKPNTIRPSKTDDITKIKGWRRKQFLEKRTVVENISKNEDEHQILNENIVQPEEKSETKQIIGKHMPRKYHEEPIPSTSSYVPMLEPKPNSSELDNILKQGENLSLNKNKKSAFVSDMLDTFLSNHAELKISYEVPKLVAEENITKPACELPITPQENTSYSASSNPRKRQNKNSLKPKTVAEKRRMLELDRQNQLLKDMKTYEDSYLKKLESSEKDNKYTVAKNVIQEIFNNQVPLSKRCWNEATRCDKQFQQFVFVRGRKIRIAGSAGGKNMTILDKFDRQTSSASKSKRANLPQPSTKCLLNRFSKPSLINATPKKDKQRLYRPIEYRPGPLCKKRKLAKNTEYDENWECRVLKMPKVKLVVYPERGKPLPLLAQKYLQLCRSEEGFISNDWAKFAVAALKSNQMKKTKVEFELPYANRQNKLLVRKLISKNTPVGNNSAEMLQNYRRSYEICLKEEIKMIISNMVKCVENQELDKRIIKEDPDLDILLQNSDKLECRPLSPINPLVHTIIKRPNIKRSKTTLELRRLNVQVIEVDVKDDETENKNCTKEYCLLGCVCNSLRGMSGIVPQHCGQAQCMVECTCSFNVEQHGHHSITLPAGTDLLSASTVVRLQDEVKKNLAKEERKFTQTVIKANNQTIMVGEGSRERQRRVPKVPKKYSNYVQKSKGVSYMEMISNGLLEDVTGNEETVTDVVENNTNEEINNNPETKKLVPIWEKNKITKPKKNRKPECFVKLERLKHLDRVLPLCMVHNLYKCHCGGNALVNTSDNNPKPKTEEDIILKPKIEDTIDAKNTSRPVPEHGASITITDASEKYCARTRALATNYYQARNKSQSFKARYAKMKEEENKYNIDFSMWPSYEDNPNNIFLENEQLHNGYESDDTLQEPELLTRKKPKKITMLNVDDTLQLAKSVAKPVDPKTNVIEDKTQVISASSFVDYDRSYMGILTPSKEWVDKFQKMLCINFSNTIIHQIRLLEWATLVKRQKEGLIQMWFNNKRHNNIILTEDRRRPSRSHMNVKLFENTQLDNLRVPSIITSLFRAKLSDLDKNESETYVILVYNGIYWEARGTIVLNNTSEMCRHRLIHKPTPVSILSPDLCSEKLNKKPTSLPVHPAPKDPLEITSPVPSIIIKSTPSMSVEVVKTPSKSPIAKVPDKSMEITKLPCKTEPNVKPNIQEESTTNLNKQLQPVKPKPGSILAPLPIGMGLNRWFMLLLENDFSILKITFTNFHIKYTHLMTAIQMARNNRKTVRIRSQSKPFPEPLNNFGIYAIPEYNDSIFFGPYENDANHGLETFRYVNGRLINTKVYNKMRGSIEKKTTGIWFTHSATVNNSLNLEPQQEDTYSSSSECSTEMTSAENAVKPQIEFVDLTGNDSDSEVAPPEKAAQQSIDPLFNVLSADFSKKVSSDITIEPIYTKTALPKSPEYDFSKANVVIQQVNNLSTAKNLHLEKKRRLSAAENVILNMKKRKLVNNSTQENAKYEPVVIDSINLDLDDTDSSSKELNKVESPEKYNVIDKRQMPELYPIKMFESTDIEGIKKINHLQINKTKIYVITNIPGVGYFEIIFYKGKYCIPLNLKDREVTGFKSLAMAIRWLDLLLQKHVLFMPQTLKINFSVLKNENAPDMPKFNEEYLNGNHMICEKGIFDMIRMSINEMDDLGFQEGETTKLLSHKCQLLCQINAKVVGSEAAASDETNKHNVTQLASRKPKHLEMLGRSTTEGTDIPAQQQTTIKMRSVLKEVPESLRIPVKQESVSILNSDSKLVTECVSDSGDKDKQLNLITTDSNSTINITKGKFCKLVNGKMIAMDPASVAKIIKPYPVQLLSRATVKRYMQPEKREKFAKYELIVPITGLQTPVKVVGVSPDSQKIPTSTSLLLSNQKHYSKVVDLTDD